MAAMDSDDVSNLSKAGGEVSVCFTPSEGREVVSASLYLFPLSFAKCYWSKLVSRYALSHASHTKTAATIIVF